ncbi:MAG TPA: tetratricopeptide repeat protein [Chthoniobacterales bacterium]|jgi:TolB-like protein/Flp pilus assembly protein TadD
MNLSTFLTELKRRNVYRVAVAYGVVAWLLIQIATQVFPFFEIPNWAVRLVVVLLLLGFPVALVLSWAFELTPEGIKRTYEVLPNESTRHRTGRKLVALTMVVAVIAVAFFAYRLSRSSESAGRTAPLSTVGLANIPEKSIAVLPFENLSSEKANAYFADGIQNEILTRLSKIADLKVISRTSTEHYKAAPGNLREIAQQLGVAHIVEGSVQRNGDQVRVNVELIKAANDSHLWAEVFDRKLTDIFSVESEIAKAIADQLRAKLSGQEEKVIAARPTNNPEAYDAYLRGLAYTLKTGGITPAKSLGAQKYLREAVRRDPKFALSWALLSYVDALGYITQSLQPTVDLREETRVAAETALTLQPDLGEALMAKGYYYYGCLKDYESAIHYFNRALQFLPNNSRISESLAYVARRRGQWSKSESCFNEAERLDPRNANLLTQHALSYFILRDFSAARQKLDQTLNITPDDMDTVALKAMIPQAKGDLRTASALLAPLRPTADEPFVIEAQVYQAILERRPGEVIARLKEMLARSQAASDYFTGELRFWLGWAEDVGGDKETARQTWQRAKTELEALLVKQPHNFALLEDLALTEMSLGDKTAAFQMCDRAEKANPTSNDAMYGPFATEILARVAAGTGEMDRAIDALDKLRVVPYRGPLVWVRPLTPALLRLDPMFDSLRDNPRFQKLTADTEAK